MTEKVKWLSYKKNLLLFFLLNINEEKIFACQKGSRHAEKIKKYLGKNGNERLIERKNDKNNMEGEKVE